MNDTILGKNHKKGCPQIYDTQDECMCDYIRPKQRIRRHRLTSRSRVKKLALELADKRFYRVAKSFFEAVERNTNEFIKTRTQCQRRGVTLK